MTRVYAVASAKGGVGKTTTTANLGATLAAAGRDVVCIDADVGMANLGGTLGIEPDGPTLHDVLADEATPADATYEGPCGLRVVPGDTDLYAFPEADPAALRTIVEAFPDADEVLLDTGAGLSHETALPLGLADDVLLVSTPEQAALCDTDKTRQLTDHLGGSVAGLVLTRTTEGDDADAANSDEVSVLGEVPEDATVAAASAAGEPLLVHAPDAPAAAAYRTLASTLVGENLDLSPDMLPDVEDEDVADENDEGGTEGDSLVPDAEADPKDSDSPAQNAETDAEDGTGDDEEPAAEPAEGDADESIDSPDDAEDDVDGDAEDETDGDAEPDAPIEGDGSGEVDETSVQETVLADEFAKAEDEEEQKKGFFGRLFG